MTVSFRATPGQAARLDALVALSGMTKRDYICARIEREEVTVLPSTRVAKALRDHALELAAALRSLGPGDCAVSVLADAAFVAERIERLYGAAPCDRDAAIIGMEGRAEARADGSCKEAPNA